MIMSTLKFLEQVNFKWMNMSILIENVNFNDGLNFSCCGYLQLLGFEIDVKF